MLILKTTAKLSEFEKAMVFDEIDTGIGGRVAEAVGLKLKDLAKTHQVLCVTHQPQVASLADHHFLVEKETDKNRTENRRQGIKRKRKNRRNRPNADRQRNHGNSAATRERND